MKKIYTLGTDLRTEEDFIEILASYNIQALIDVRSYPKSKINIFCKKELEELLNKQGIDYYFLGKELGGFRKGGYKAYALTESFREGIEILEKIAINKHSVIVCAEKFPWKCHRRWIAGELYRRGWEVLHIIDKDKIWAPAYRLKY
ncbi:MAG: DUF488 domain-containing protein [Nitrospirae bacterium]|jgi:uncharacterized protein (DUF488 family)|nr:DUF488 domain-containing protein [Nitrospirota bacterium]